MENGDVHIWLVPLDTRATCLQFLMASLSSGEVTRADRFRFAADRDRFVARRGMLRRILCQYIDTKPERFDYVLGPQGKPALAEPFADHPLRFNISHSGGQAVYAVTSHADVGVDVEQIDPARADAQVANQFFAPEEVASLQTLDAERWVEGFFNCWTRKEAYIKAVGGGLSIPLDAFVVSLLPSEPTELKRIDAEARPYARWTLQSLDCGRDFKGCVAIEGETCRVHYRSWQEAWPDYCVATGA